MKKPLISVIIPVYKVEEYLVRCVKSVQNQTYNNLEIILVDDGSPDNCPAMCDRLAENDSRIKVIHKENGGLSSARNAGLDVAKGEYIAFVDSDDYVNRRFIELLYKALVKYSADISVCKFKYVYPDKLISEDISVGKFKTRLFTNLEALDYCFINEYAQMIVSCCKLYKRKLFERIRFPLGKISEDNYTTTKTFAISQRIILCDVPMYYYLQREGSIMHSNDYFKLTHYFVEAMEELEEFCNETISDERVRKSIIRNSVVVREERALEEYYRLFLDKDFEKMKQRKIIIDEYSKRFLSLGGKYRLKYRLYHIHPALFIAARIAYDMLENIKALRREF